MKTFRFLLASALYLSLSLALSAQDQTPSSDTSKQSPFPNGAQQAPPKDRGQGGDRGPGGEGDRMRGQGVGGIISDIKDNAITVTTRDGKTVTAKLTGNTKFMKNRQPATLKDFKIGDRVMVSGEAAGENIWNAKFVALVDANAMMARMQAGMGKEFIAGEVKSIDETKLTILRIDGQTQVIEADENTSFKKQSESITLADIKPGDKVMGRGELKNGVFVPKMLRVGDLPQMQMLQSGPSK